MKVRCDNVAAILSEFTVVLGSQLVSIRLNITHKFQNSFPSVGVEGVAVTGKIGDSDQPSIGTTNLPTDSRRSFTWKKTGITSVTEKGTTAKIVPVNNTTHDKFHYQTNHLRKVQRIPLEIEGREALTMEKVGLRVPCLCP